ncbi:MAG: hypothetical protein HY657_11665 [Acidobacteria bacterium]|nr:hypothetical protein [Acidobacteriota bacterium]
MVSLPFALIVTAAAAWLLSEQPAYAYIDPGTGSLIYQTLLTLLLGVGLALRRWRESIVRFMKRLGGRDAR